MKNKETVRAREKEKKKLPTVTSEGERVGETERRGRG